MLCGGARIDRTAHPSKHSNQFLSLPPPFFLGGGGGGKSGEIWGTRRGRRKRMDSRNSYVDSSWAMMHLLAKASLPGEPVRNSANCRTAHAQRGRVEGGEHTFTSYYILSAFKSFSLLLNESLLESSPLIVTLLTLRDDWLSILT